MPNSIASSACRTAFQYCPSAQYVKAANLYASLMGPCSRSCSYRLISVSAIAGGEVRQFCSRCEVIRAILSTRSSKENEAISGKLHRLQEQLKPQVLRMCGRHVHGDHVGVGVGYGDLGAYRYFPHGVGVVAKRLLVKVVDRVGSTVVIEALLSPVSHRNSAPSWHGWATHSNIWADSVVQDLVNVTVTELRSMRPPIGSFTGWPWSCQNLSAVSAGKWSTASRSSSGHSSAEA